MVSLKTISALQLCRKALEGIPNCEMDSQALLAHALRCSPHELFLDLPISEKAWEKCRQYIARRRQREPLEYITGEMLFYDTPLLISSSVLIPRQETEQLVDLICNHLPMPPGSHIWDLGTGSGCIAIAIKKHTPQAHLHAVDISPAALAIAKRNSQREHLDIDFRLADLTTIQGKATGIVCNPPYVLPSEYPHLEPEVLYEPPIALIAPDFFSFYRELSHLANQLPLGGWMALEAPYPSKLLSIFQNPHHSITIRRDLAGRERFLFLEVLSDITEN